ncbi:splicing factor 1 [Hyalella azteca]|uniref:Splicing factor 1 n=1 Tax=Hyalella azteca TaxID=294128 RepID=A0A8B7PJF8_HYAAZ|nr:splicing factor 1 [Hyalella azteca]
MNLHCWLVVCGLMITADSPTRVSGRAFFAINLDLTKGGIIGGLHRAFFGEPPTPPPPTTTPPPPPLPALPPPGWFQWLALAAQNPYYLNNIQYTTTQAPTTITQPPTTTTQPTTTTTQSTTTTQRPTMTQPPPSPYLMAGGPLDGKPELWNQWLVEAPVQPLGPMPSLYNSFYQLSMANGNLGNKVETIYTDYGMLGGPTERKMNLKLVTNGSFIPPSFTPSPNWRSLSWKKK